MKYLRFIFILTFAFLTQMAYSQNFLPKEKALEQLEIKQASLKTEYEEGSVNQLKMDIYVHFFEILIIYIKEDNDIPESLSVTYEKCLSKFEDNQEDVVIVKDEISAILTIN